MRNKKRVQMKTLRGACETAGLSVAEVARRAGKARTTLYLAWEKPSRYPLAYGAIAEQLKEKGK